MQYQELFRVVYRNSFLTVNPRAILVCEMHASGQVNDGWKCWLRKFCLVTGCFFLVSTVNRIHGLSHVRLLALILLMGTNWESNHTPCLAFSTSRIVLFFLKLTFLKTVFKLLIFSFKGLFLHIQTPKSPYSLGFVNSVFKLCNLQITQAQILSL